MHDQRVARVRNLLRDHNIDSLFLSNYYNILYLTGFKTLTTDEREAFVLVTRNSVYLFTDARYVCKDPNVDFKLIEPGKGLFHHLRSVMEKERLHSLGIESEDLRVHEYIRLQTLFRDTTITPIEKQIIRQRAIKEQDEVDRIKKACVITGQCLKEIIPTITVGDTEKQIAFRIETWIRERGYDLAFDPIVAIDKHSAIPHYFTKEGTGAVRKDSVVLMDFGVKYKDYLSDITRMVFFNPTSETIGMYATLLHVQNETIGQIGKVLNPKIIDGYCRDQLSQKGLPNFSHSLGHGVGLEIHEFPKISQLSDDTILTNNAFTIEPGIYLDNKWGMRIEDTVVYHDGKADVLTSFSKEPIILK